MEPVPFSMKDVAQMLLSLIDASSEDDLTEMGVIHRDYIGQSIHTIQVDRDALVRISGVESDW